MYEAPTVKKKICEKHYYAASSLYKKMFVEPDSPTAT